VPEPARSSLCVSVCEWGEGARVDALGVLLQGLVCQNLTRAWVPLHILLHKQAKSTKGFLHTHTHTHIHIHTHAPTHTHTCLSPYIQAKSTGIAKFDLTSSQADVCTARITYPAGCYGGEAYFTPRNVNSPSTPCKGGCSRIVCPCSRASKVFNNQCRMLYDILCSLS
jgi:hypothetical protein